MKLVMARRGIACDASQGGAGFAGMAGLERRTFIGP